MMKALALSLLAFTSIALSACVTTQPISFDYDAAELASYQKQGDETVFGQAFLRQAGGGVVVCAGEPVYLLPNIGPFAEAYLLRKQRIIARVDGKDSVITAGLRDPQMSKAIRTSQCDAQGNFTFENVPAANWIVYSRVQWVVGQYQVPQGGDLFSILVTDGVGESKILLTDANRI